MVCGVVWCGAWCGVRWCVVWCAAGVVWYMVRGLARGVVRCVVQCGTVWCGVVRGPAQWHGVLHHCTQTPLSQLLSHSTQPHPLHCRATPRATSTPHAPHTMPDTAPHHPLTYTRYTPHHLICRTAGRCVAYVSQTMLKRCWVLGIQHKAVLIDEITIFSDFDRSVKWMFF